MKSFKSFLAALGCAAIMVAGSAAVTPSAAAAAEGTVTVSSIAAPAAPATPSAGTVTASSAPEMRFVSYNICGNMCGDPAQFDNQRRIDTVVNETRPEVWGAEQVFLSEVCRSQYDAILAKVAPRGYHGLYTATLSGYPGICHGSDYGMAVFVKGPVLDSAVLDLTQGGESEPIKNPCLKHKAQGRAVWACSIHLYWSSDPTLREAEAAELAAQAKAWEDAGTPVVLGGDFNAPPTANAMSSFYDAGTGGSGQFIEVDETDRDYFTQACLDQGATRCRSGEDTKDGGKIDYVFLSAQSFANPKADSLPLDTLVTDHQMLRGSATWKN